MAPQVHQSYCHQLETDYYPVVAAPAALLPSNSVRPGPPVLQQFVFQEFPGLFKNGDYFFFSLPEGEILSFGESHTKIFGGSP